VFDANALMFDCGNISVVVNGHLEFECANWERVAVRASLLYAMVCDSCCNIGAAGCRHCTQSLQFVAEREC
jgi:hypothetical protein